MIEKNNSKFLTRSSDRKESQCSTHVFVMTYRPKNDTTEN